VESIRAIVLFSLHLGVNEPESMLYRLLLLFKMGVGGQSMATYYKPWDITKSIHKTVFYSTFQ